MDDGIQYDDDNYSGWRFCSICNNYLEPKTQKIEDGKNQTQIYFKCTSKKCGNKGIVVKEIDSQQSRDKEQYLMKRQVFERTKGADIYNTDMISDPTMQTNERRCIHCGYEGAVFYLKQDFNKPCIIFQYVCRSCGETWNKDDEKLREQQEQQQYQEDDLDDSYQNVKQQEVEDNLDDEDDDDLFGEDEEVQQ